MDTYRRVKQQIAELEKKAAELRRAEAAKVIADIRKKIAKFELQPDDLFGALPAAVAAPVKARRGRPSSTVKAAAKYQDPVSGKTWSGHGKAPNWIRGQDRQAFLIGGALKVKTEPAKKAVVATKTATPKSAATKSVKKALAKSVAKKPTVSKPAEKKTIAPKVKTAAIAEAVGETPDEAVANVEAARS